MNLNTHFLSGLLLCCSASGMTVAKVPDNIEAIQREARIVADVMKSALRSELHSEMRITAVTGEYLAEQGVLISVRMNTPWLSISEAENVIDFRAHFNLEEIPTMVENILADLHINVRPYEPEALEALRAMRTEQRELRLEQREIRRKLREKRRALVRAEDDDDRDDAKEDIVDLERELAAVDVQHQALAADIETQYEEIRDYRGGPNRPRPAAEPEAISALVARTACDYGGTLKSLNADDYLTIALRRDETTEYFAFKMNQVRRCSDGDIPAENLLSLAYRYDG